MKNLEILKNRKLVSYCILGIILLILDILLIFKPQTLTIKKISPQIKKLSGDLKGFYDDKKNLAQLTQSLKNFKKKSSELNKKIIEEGDLLSIIEKISKIGREEKIKINQISPLEDQKAKKIGSFSKGDIYPVIININITAGFHQLGKFINRLENEDEFLKVLSLDIKFDKQLYTNQVVRLVLGALIVKK